MAESGKERFKEEMERRVGGLEERMSQMESKISKMDERMADIGEKLDAVMGRGLKEFEGSLRRAVSAIRNRQKDLEMKVENQYKPRLLEEEDLLESLKQMMRDVKDRLTTYGRMQKKLNKLYEQMDRVETEVIGKVGRTEFEEHKREMEENIRRFKSQLDLL